jgi:hypothetical protein
MAKVGWLLATCASCSGFLMVAVAATSCHITTQQQLMIPSYSVLFWWSALYVSGERSMTTAATENASGSPGITGDLSKDQQQFTVAPDFTLQCLEPKESSETQLFTPTLQCIYRDQNLFPDNIRLEVPTHFVKLSRERVYNEINAYLLHPQRSRPPRDATVVVTSWWSERVVLEVFFYATVQVNGTGMPSPTPTPIIPSRLETAHGWLRDDVDICDWEGITCGEISFGPGRWVDEAVIDPMASYLEEEPEHEQEVPSVPTTAVTKIDLTDYDLIGTLPSELHMLRHLRRLDLKRNHLVGTIPTTFPHLTYLEYLDLGSNNLHGIIPKTFSVRRINLRELRLPENQLTGSLLPNLFAGWSHVLRVLDISKNNFSGSLRDDLFPYYLSELTKLSLSSNSFTGTIPTQLANLTKVQVLHMADNKFIGTLPTEMAHLYLYLQDLNLGENRLTGTIPTEIMMLTLLNSLVLRGNRLTGTIPEGDDRIKGRRRRNKLKTGTMWSQFHRLRLLDLGDNLLTGTIPPELIFGLNPVLTR